MKNLKKLFSYKNKETAIKNCLCESDKIAVKKHFDRIDNKKNDVPVKEWLDSIIVKTTLAERPTYLLFSKDSPK